MVVSPLSFRICGDENRFPSAQKPMCGSGRFSVIPPHLKQRFGDRRSSALLLTVLVLLLAAAAGVGLQSSAAEDVPVYNCSAMSSNPDKVVSDFSEIANVLTDDNDCTTTYVHIKLGNSITCTDQIIIPEKWQVLIDLNGKTLQGDGSHRVITVQGSLTLDDSSALNDSSAEGSGTITGGNGGVSVKTGGTFTMKRGNISKNNTSGQGAGVIVQQGGTFKMYGGTISNNSSSYNQGGGVFIGVNGTFTMGGGTISNNDASGQGGGVYIGEAGTFTMDGGTISNNSSSSNGGGVFFSNRAEFKIGGIPKITENTVSGKPDNVYLYTGVMIQIVNRLDAGAKIGVTKQLSGVVFTSGLSTYGVTSNFFSDNEGYVVVNDNGEASLERVYTISFVNDDGTVFQSGKLLYGAIPSYTGETPTKAATAQNTFTFAGWNPTITAVTGDANYTAVYNSTVNKYKITFVNEDGTVLKEAKEYDYGTAAADIARPADPSKAPDEKYTYTFSGWTPALAAVTENQTYTAAYIRSDKNAAPITTVPVAADGWTEDGEEHALLAVAGASDGGTFRYRLNENRTWTSEPGSLKASAAGEYKVWYYIKGTGIWKDNGSDSSPLGTLTVVIAEKPEEPVEMPVRLEHYRQDGGPGIPLDIPKDTKLTLTLKLTGNDRKTIEKKAVITVQPGDRFTNASFTFEKEPEYFDYSFALSVAPSTVRADIYSTEPVSVKEYKLSVESIAPEENEEKAFQLKVMLRWDDGTVGWKPEILPVYALPEDEIGAYVILKDGTKEYLLFHTYSICMAWLGSDELCSGYEHCFHKENPFVNPFVKP